MYFNRLLQAESFLDGYDPHVRTPITISMTRKQGCVLFSSTSNPGGLLHSLQDMWYKMLQDVMMPKKFEVVDRTLNIFHALRSLNPL